MTSDRSAPSPNGSWDGRTVVVTGASGFLGRHLVGSLVERGAHVIAQSRAERAADRNGVDWIRLDLRDGEAVRAALRHIQPHTIFHMSSLANGSRAIELVQPMLEAEVIAAINIMTAVGTTPIAGRLVMCGSLEEPASGEPPSSPYAAAKAATRLYSQMFQTLYGAPIVNTRIFMAYGPGQPDWKLIPYAIERLANGAPVNIASPERLVDWIYVSDVAEGLIAAAEAPDIDGRTLDIGSGQLVSIGDLVGRLASIVAPETKLDTGKPAPRLNEVVKVAQAAETQRLTGWQAIVGLDIGLQRTFAAFRRAAFLMLITACSVLVNDATMAAVEMMPP